MEKIKTERSLYLRERKNLSNGVMCLTSTYEGADKEPKIVIVNPEVREKYKLEPGRAMLTLIPFKNNKGYIAISGKMVLDEAVLDTVTDRFRVTMVVNGKAAHLKREKKMLSIFFDAANYYDPKIIVKRVREKLNRLQLPEEFDKEAFCNSFLENCEIMEKEYKKYMIAEHGRVH